MPPPGNKATTPFKTMDIKEALLAGGNRKRKATSPQVCASEPKSLKLGTESSDHENDLQVIDEVCGVKMTLEQNKLDPSFGDCKENKDINAAKAESPTVDCKENKDINAAKAETPIVDCKEIKDINAAKVSPIVDCKENKQSPEKVDSVVASSKESKQNPPKDKLSPSVNKVSSKKLKPPSSKSPTSKVGGDVKLLSEKSNNSDTSSSCNKLNSVNVSLNVSGMSEVEQENSDERNMSNSKNDDKSDSQNKEGENAIKDEVKEDVVKKKITPAESQHHTPSSNTMDIKQALLASGNRKRKAPSPQVCSSEPKSLKLITESNDHEDVQITDKVCEVKVMLERINVDSSVNDCKENKQSPAKEVDGDVELSSEKSNNSDTSSSCDELNSVDVSLNTSGMSIVEEENSDKGNISNSKNGDKSDSQSKEGENATKDEVKSDSKSKDGENTAKKEKVKKKKMTPAEAQKRTEERNKKQKEKLLKKEELEQKKRERLLEKEKKLKEKLLRKEREELERKERERIKQEKKEQEEKERLQKQKEKEEKLKLKQMILEQKLEEKKKKEEMRLKREEELKKAEEEKLKAKLEKEQKEKEKKERAKAAFVKFFVKGNANATLPPTQSTEKEGAFLPFQVSDDMILAPVVPPAAQERFDKKQLDHYLECQDGETYLQILKSGSYKDVRKRKKDRKLRDSEADVIVIDQAEIGLCPKLLQFHENLRPAYWGTWRKKSKNIGPRKPFGQEDIFDYSVDSDDEWDEGGPGESLSGTEQEDVESEDDYEVDNEFMVPHGYLSDEEEKNEDDEEVNDPEKQKALLKFKLQQFEMERKKKTTELKPIILGCHFVNNPAFQDNGLEMFLQNYAAEVLSELPIPTFFTVTKNQTDSSNNRSQSPKSSTSNSAKKKKVPVPEEAIPHLILLVHGNTKNRRILAEEFQKFWLEQSGDTSEAAQEMNKLPLNAETDPPREVVNEPSDSAEISLKQLHQTIREIASYGKPPESSTFNKHCWWVHDTVREKYGLIDAPLPNQWKYVSQKDTEPLVKVNNSASIKEFLSAN